MRHWLSVIAVATLAPAAVHAAQANTCAGTNVTRIGFADAINSTAEDKRSYELWRCGDGWHFSNLAGEQAYAKPMADGRVATCVKNSNNKQEFCCPESASTGNKTEVKTDNKGSENLAKKSSEWVCGPEEIDPTKAPEGSDPKTHHALYIIPLNKDGSRAEVRYKIRGLQGKEDTKATGKAFKFKTLKLNVEAIYPNKKKEGSIQVEADITDKSFVDEKDPDACNAQTGKGSLCKLPPDLLDHTYTYEMNEDEKIKAVMDKQAGKPARTPVTSTDFGRGDVAK